MTQPGTVPTRGPAALLDALRDDLVQGVYHPRERLVEVDLAARYGANRAAVRSALVALASEGLIERERNRGARVRAVSVDEAIEIAEVRLALQALCARHAAERGTAEEKRELAGLLDDLRAAVERNDGEALYRANMAIEESKRRMSGQQTASGIIERLLQQDVHRFFPLVLPERRVESLHENERIVAAIVAGDGEEAERATRDQMVHLVSALQEIRAREPGGGRIA